MMQEQYEFEERCMCSLRFAPQMLVWGMRYWVRCYRNGDDPLPYLRKGFLQNGIHGVAEALDALMLVVSATSRCTIEMRCMRFPKLSVDEERLIAVFAEAHEREEFPAAAAFSRPLARDEAWPASQAAGRPGTKSVPAGDIGTRARFYSHDGVDDDLLAVWLPPTAMHLAWGHAKEVADAFTAAGIEIRQDRNIRPYPIAGETIQGQATETRTLH